MADQTNKGDRQPRDLFDQARDVVEDSRQLADDVEQMYENVSEADSIRELYDRNPYAVLGAAAGTGYVLGGGLLTPFTKRLARFGLKALVVPVALSKLKELNQPAEHGELGEDEKS